MKTNFILDCSGPRLSTVTGAVDKHCTGENWASICQKQEEGKALRYRERERTLRQAVSGLDKTPR